MDKKNKQSLRPSDESEGLKKHEETTEEFEEELDREEKIEEKEVELEEDLRVKNLEDQLKRAVADYRNLENRVQEERIEFVKFANKNLLENLLPAFDTIILASQYSEDQSLQVTVKYLLDILKQAGVEKVETIGQKFDPVTMEAIEVIAGNEGEVVEESQPGFTLHGKILRPARVKVGREKE